MTSTNGSQDFALDPDENKMRIAAHAMVRNLTSGMAMITCRDHLSSSISTNFRNLCLRALKAAPQKDLLDQAASMISQENVEIACCFIQKTAVEKAIPEMDARLNSEYEARKQARIEGRRYCDPAVLTYQAERMPECIRLKLGGMGVGQMTIYDEFARNIPGFLPNTDPVPTQPVQPGSISGIHQELHSNVVTSSFLAKPIPVMPAAAALPQTLDDMTQIYDKVISEVTNCIRLLMATYPTSNAHLINLHNLHDALVSARNSRDLHVSVNLLHKVVEGLFDGLGPQLNSDSELAFRYKESHMLVMKALQDPRAYGTQWTTRQVTKAVLELRDEIRYNVEAIDTLFRNHVVNLPQYDNYLAQLMENGLNYVATSFAVQLCQLYFSGDRAGSVLNENRAICQSETIYFSAFGYFIERMPDLYNTLDTLNKFANHSRQVPEGLNQLIDVIRTNNETGFQDRGGPTSLMHSGISQARQVDDPPGLHEKTEYLLREWINLFHSSSAGRDSTKAFSIFVNQVLGIVAGVLIQDHDVQEFDFHQLPYHRIFIVLFLDLNSPEQILDNINFSVLTAFCNTLHILRPSKLPGFAFAWLEIVSHRVVLGRMLQHTPQQKAWGMFAQLLIDLFKYLAPFLRNAELPKSVSILYKGTLRVLLVLLHDFPEFLCDYHYGFCDVIPPNCIQMRNLILSAFPRNMRLPDPFTPNLKVDMLNDIGQEPRVVTNFTSMIQPPSFKKDLDSYIKTRAPVTFLSELRSNLQTSNEPGQRYNIPLINALVLYVGTQAISYIASKHSSPNNTTITHSSHMDIFQNLAVDLDTEGRYLFLNAIANQLRYPNCHTHYFSCILLYLFAEANTEAIQEQITRVLLERLIVNRPHPWGLLITFIELIKNPLYHFWDHQFVHCAPEIKKLFDSVARSCMQQKQSQTVREIPPERVLKISWKDHVTNEMVEEKMECKRELVTGIGQRKMRFAGHVLRGSSGELANLVLEGTIDGKRDRGKQRRTWSDDVKNWSRTGNLGKAEDKSLWHSIVVNLRIEDDT
ncbi:CCR4-NOT transcription complex subunit 1 [Nymphon striatum]|nr:CCR4-NOT transcription complex subunit 1 [Nymphon striatum]